MWFRKNKAPKWEHDPVNVLALNIVQPYRESSQGAYCVWNGEPVAMQCEFGTLTVICRDAFGMAVFLWSTPEKTATYTRRAVEVRRIEELERFVKDHMTPIFAQWYGIDMRHYSLLELKRAGDAMLRGYRVGMEVEIA